MFCPVDAFLWLRTTVPLLDSRLQRGLTSKEINPYICFHLAPARNRIKWGVGNCGSVHNLSKGYVCSFRWKKSAKAPIPPATVVETFEMRLKSTRGLLKTVFRKV
jgi:hypothetical protein